MHTDLSRDKALLTHVTDQRQEGQKLGAAPELSAITRLYELSTRLVLSSGLESLLEEVLHAVIELQGADFGNVQLYDPVSETLSIVAQQGFSQPFLDCFRHVSAQESSACGLALSRRERVIIFDTETDPAFQAFRHMAALSGFRAVQSTPLFTRAGEVLGMLSTHFRLPHQPSAQELRLTDLYAKQAAEMIERHRMEEELRRTNEALLAEIHERERVEQSLREREEQLETLFETIPDALVITDASGSVVRVNTAARVLFGLQDRPDLFLLPLEEQRKAMRVRSEDGQPRPDDQLNHARLLRGEVIPPTNPSITLFRVLDGEERYASTTGAPLYDADGHISGAVTVSRDITEQRQAEREREQQAQQLQLQSRLLELAHDAILVRDPSSRVLFWNSGAQNLYGWSAEEARGRVTHSLIQTVFPTSLAQVDERLERYGHWEEELTHTCRDGRVVTVESRQALLRDGRGRPTAILEINRDITERRQLEQRAQAAHTETIARLSFFQQLIDALPSSIYLVYGNEARLLLTNRAAQGVWGATWRPDQPMGEFLASAGIGIMTSQGRPMPLSELATLRAVRQGETVLHLQEVIRRSDSTSLPVLVNAVVLDVPAGWQLLRPGAETPASAQQEPAEAVALVVHHDVSALKEAEYLKDEFIGVAAHELRNPLGALKGFADMLVYYTAQGRGPQLADWQREAVEEIEQATARLDKLTEDLLDVTRLQAGRLTLSRKPTDLVSLVRQQVRQAQMTTRRHTVSFEPALSELQAEVDRGRIEQVLANLLGNAVKYSPQGGPIEVALHRKQSQALLSVRDQGIGIPAEQQGRLFGRFVRAENARATQITGTGLGLYLSRELIEQHGGHLCFESLEGAGSTFFLTLPVLAT